MQRKIIFRKRPLREFGSMLKKFFCDSTPYFIVFVKQEMTREEKELYLHDLVNGLSESIKEKNE
tara:strand:- start:2325 stop:2516 length:192 start_codon:yes stop_codon:yes gene_type:complete